MESDSSFGVFGRRGPPVRSSSSLIRFLISVSRIPVQGTSQTFRMTGQLILSPRVPPEHLSNVHREVEEKRMKEQDRRETEQIIREEPDEEPVKLHSSRSCDSPSPPRRRGPPVKHQSIIRRFDILSSFRSEICRRMFEGGQHHPSAGSGSVGGSSFFHEAEQHESPVKLHRSSSNELLPPDKPDHQPVMRSRSFDWLPPFMPEPRPVHPAAIWERIQKFLFHPSGCEGA